MIFMGPEPKVDKRRTARLPPKQNKFVGKGPLVNFSIKLVDSSNRAVTISGNVERGINFIQAFSKVIAQNGGQVFVVHDKRFGFGIKSVHIPHLGVHIRNTGQFYINESLPCKTFGGMKLWLNAGNIVVGKSMKTKFKDDWDQTADLPGAGCGGSTWINTSGYAFNHFDLWDPRSNRVSNFGESSPEFDFSEVLFDAIRIHRMPTPAEFFSSESFSILENFKREPLSYPAEATKENKPEPEKTPKKIKFPEKEMEIQSGHEAEELPVLYRFTPQDYIKDEETAISFSDPLEKEETPSCPVYETSELKTEERKSESHDPAPKKKSPSPVSVGKREPENEDEAGHYIVNPSPSRLRYTETNERNSCFKPLIEAAYSPFLDKPKKPLKKKKKKKSKKKKPSRKNARKLLKKVSRKPKKPKAKKKSRLKLKKAKKDVKKLKVKKPRKKAKTKPKISKKKKPKIQSKKKKKPKVKKKKRLLKKKKKGKLIFSMLKSKKRKRKR